MSDRARWAWRPQDGPQKALVDCWVKEIFFGGTRGGGKTYGVLGKWALKERRYGVASAKLSRNAKWNAFDRGPAKKSARARGRPARPSSRRAQPRRA
jgi:hypothetical protein